MPSDFATSDRTAAPFPQGALVASIVVMLSTAAPQSAAAFEEVDRVQVPAIDPTVPVATTTAFDRLPSKLEYTEVTGPQTLTAATAGPVTPLTGISADHRERIRERIRSIMLESDDSRDGTPPSPAAINDALRFVDLLPVDSPTLHVSVADDGEINFFRRRPGLYVDVGFFGDGQVHYYARVEDLGIDLAESQPFSGRSLPRGLIIPITTE